jgi:putative sterol carrier protein
VEHTDDTTAEEQGTSIPQAEGGPASDEVVALGATDAVELASMVAGASDEQLAEGMTSENRQTVLDEIFRRMAEHVEPAKIKDVSAVIHWRIGGPPDGVEDHYEVVIENERCEVSDEPGREPRVTLKVGSVDFLKLVSGAQPGPVMFMAGKLRIEGDLMFASQVATYFRIPKAAQA